MGVSLRHFSSLPFWVSRRPRVSSPICRRIAIAKGNAGYFTVTCSDGSVEFSEEWKLDVRRMVPPTAKQVGSVRAWREEANKFRERNSKHANNLDDVSGNGSYGFTDTCSDGSVEFSEEWKLDVRSTPVRMVPPTAKQVGSVREEAITDDTGSDGSVEFSEEWKLDVRSTPVRMVPPTEKLVGSVREEAITDTGSDGSVEFSEERKLDVGSKPVRKVPPTAKQRPVRKVPPTAKQRPVRKVPPTAKQRPCKSDLSTAKETISKVGKCTDQSKIRADLRKIYNKVHVVENVSTAKETVGKLMNQYRSLVHACDTEVSRIDVKTETPVDHGKMICFSIYCGPEADFGDGKSCIWVDLLGENGRDILAEFKPFFEEASIKKVWHNYSFDSHIISNDGIKLSGFHGDTMHMARLWDSSRQTSGGGYSLEALTSDPRVLGETSTKEGADLFGKISMKTIFGKAKLKKDGSEGKKVIIPPVEDLQKEDREAWISYSALDSISTLKLYESMKKQLQAKKWVLDGKLISGKSMYDFYQEYWQPFGELLVKMEAEGMLVDKNYLKQIEGEAKKDKEKAVTRFRNWASKYCPDAKYMNVGSDAQLQQLFFGGISNRNNNEVLPYEKLFKVPNVDKVIEEGKKRATKFRNIKLHRISDSPLPTENYTASGWPSVGGDTLKALAGKVSAEYDYEVISDASLEENMGDDDCILQRDESIEPQHSNTSVESDTSAYGTAFNAFGGGESGKEACDAIAALYAFCSIDSLLSNFILPLQGSNVSGKDSRVHCSLNINTETGRLSARRPNLQNQPALEKDRYRIRKAFTAAHGNSLIVADYGQLELRLLAHLARCESMIEAFKAGGDFHSRTAMNMFPDIAEAVEKGEVLLERKGQEKSSVPLLKEKFASKRRKAKMLNFSIAYGKTAIGLSRDWKVSVKDAQKTVDLWYKDRPEVREWQELRKKEAINDGSVLTLLGRARKFPVPRKRAQKNHIERAAINTPVQGSAADVAMCAKLEISRNQRLKELGWNLLLQVHDEVILEGPSGSAEEAIKIVKNCMCKPFNGKNILRVDLSVDVKCAQNWYAAK